ncbi:MAG TPA: hypothetical protein PLP33_23560 [Leptospiraceae bacterium]|nr:hypothetical protein [Leptospiraceae bacterium]
MISNSPKNKLIENNEFFNNIKELIEEKFSLILEQNQNKNFYIEKYNLFENIRSTKFLFNYLRNYDKKNDFDRLFSEMLYKTLTDIEKSVSGSAFYAFYFILNFLSMNKVQRETFITDFEKILKENENYLPNKNEFELLLTELFKQKPNWYFNFYKKLNELAGLKNRVLLKTSNSSNLIIEMKTGYKFDGSIHPLFFKNGIKTLEINDFKVVLVDGIIEKSSEIFNILNFCHETKTPVLLIAQKFDDEVLNIIAVNYIKNGVPLYPFQLETSLYTLNQITDLSVITGTIPISVLSGDSLITKNIESIKTTERCIINQDNFIIENKKTSAEVENHIRFLIRKKQEKANEYKTIEISDYNTLYDKRIEKLLGSVVEVQIPKTWSNSKTNDFMSFFDELLKKIKTYYTHGLVDEKLLQHIKTLPIKTSLISKHELLLQVIYGLKAAVSFSETLLNTNALIIQA